MGLFSWTQRNWVDKAQAKAPTDASNLPSVPMVIPDRTEETIIPDYRIICAMRKAISRLWLRFSLGSQPLR